jgi:hypothetical protein
MDVLWIIRLVVFGLSHWVLAILLLRDLAYRKRVLGGKKWPWALAIIFISWLGSILYLLCHPQIFYENNDGERF